MNRIKRILLSTSILLGSFFLWGLWMIIPVDYYFEFPFYDLESRSLSFNPVKKLGYQLYDITPYLVDRFIPIVYLTCFNIVGKMKMPYLGNIWNYYIAFHAFLFIDYLLFFKQVPILIYCIASMALIQLSYTVYSLTQIKEDYD